MNPSLSASLAADSFVAEGAPTKAFTRGSATREARGSAPPVKAATPVVIPRSSGLAYPVGLAAAPMAADSATRPFRPPGMKRLICGTALAARVTLSTPFATAAPGATAPATSPANVPSGDFLRSCFNLFSI